MFRTAGFLLLIVPLFCSVIQSFNCSPAGPNMVRSHCTSSMHMLVPIIALHILDIQAHLAMCVDKCGGRTT